MKIDNRYIRRSHSEAMALEHALLAVDPHGQRLMPVDALEMTSFDEKALRLSLAEIARRSFRGRCKWAASGLHHCRTTGGSGSTMASSQPKRMKRERRKRRKER